MSDKVRLASTQEVAPGTGKVVEASGKEFALFNIDGSFFVMDNICPHQGGPMGEGAVEGDNVVCPWHAWSFNVKSGESPVNPRARIDTFAVSVEGEDIFITL